MASKTVAFVLASILSLCCSIVRADGSVELTFPPAIPSNFQAHLDFAATAKFTWSSTFPNITLQIYQGPDDQGRFPHDTLLDGVSGLNEYKWRVASLRPFMTRDSPFHLYLFATNNPNCTTCHSNSSEFWIRKNAAPRNSGSGSALEIGLGVGLGLGIPLVAGIAATVAWFCVRKRRRQREESQTPQDGRKEPPPPFSSLPASGGIGSMEQKSPVEVEATGRRKPELHPEAAVAEAPANTATDGVVELE